MSACLENEIFRDTNSGTEVQLQSDSSKLRATRVLPISDNYELF
jgi:hypothetical protein